MKGPLTLKGKCWLSPETEVYNTQRDIHFIPDAESDKLLPVMNYYTDDGKNYPLGGVVQNDLCVKNEHNDLYLGNADSYSGLDLTVFPEDGSLVNAEVTINSIVYGSQLEWGNSFECKLVDIKAIS